MLEYPPDVSVRSPSGDAEVGDDSDCRREEDGRTGVESSADPDPGAWTAEEVIPAVYGVSVIVYPGHLGTLRTSSVDGIVGSWGATISSPAFGSCANVLSFSESCVARIATPGAEVSDFGALVSLALLKAVTSLGAAVLVSVEVVALAAAGVDALEPGVCV